MSIVCPSVGPEKVQQPAQFDQCFSQMCSLAAYVCTYIHAGAVLCMQLRCRHNTAWKNPTGQNEDDVKCFKSFHLLQAKTKDHL